jgi:hypothetical protein
MRYDKATAERIAERLDGRPGVTSKHMFGGKMWWLHGNICCGTRDNAFMLKAPPERIEELLARPGVTGFAPRGLAIKGWLCVDLEQVDAEEALDWWINLAVTYCKSLAPND